MSETAAPVSTTVSAPVTTTHADDHDHSDETGSIAPSPTDSVGCEPHGDHVSGSFGYKRLLFTNSHSVALRWPCHYHSRRLCL